VRVRALAVLLLAAGAFAALYAVSQAGEDHGEGTDLVAPAVIGKEVGVAAPPKLERSGPLPSLMPARPEAGPGPAPPTPPSGTSAPSTPPPPAAAPAPAPPPSPAPSPLPAPPPPSDPGRPFYDDG